MKQDNLSAMKPGDRVRHQTRSSSFGTDTVLSVDEGTRSVLVEWDTLEVTRTTESLTARQAHVGVPNLTVISS